MLCVDKLSIQSREICLLSPLSFSITKGEVLGVVGASGSGKSLLAQALLGQVPEGFSLSGQVIYAAGDRRVLAAQSASVLDPLRRISSQLNYALKRVPKGATRKQRFPLAADISRCYRHQLSGGMAKRVLLAQACWQASEIMIADEPCCGLDTQSAEAIYQHLAYLARSENVAVMVISHNLRHLLTVADRILVLRDGKMVEITTSANIRSGACHSYTQSLWAALPEHWGQLDANAA
ncbi:MULTISPECIES: ATP-binding cassette domain-containing protein [unclassified Shewanella]|uniref:ATP-binding cassette domain-containing protein n=1 Tax=unclassified Shewanella TaxID=196818 RepID=UPI001BC316CF|nr:MULTISPECIES: ATP-binding cassette domain-containing protein [unclassified Shewanella]GIU19775.1 peptide ABC transporter ATP-binding protein [Shewanella sp. MBTL60-112-B1]GIU27816.1 peptide ABC transporter ATP-binding protein [Shewanella sp. MBTL60-112-B2]